MIYKRVTGEAGSSWRSAHILVDDENVFYLFTGYTQRGEKKTKPVHTLSLDGIVFPIGYQIPPGKWWIFLIALKAEGLVIFLVGQNEVIDPLDVEENEANHLYLLSLIKELLGSDLSRLAQFPALRDEMIVTIKAKVRLRRDEDPAIGAATLVTDGYKGLDPRRKVEILLVQADVTRSYKINGC